MAKAAGVEWGKLSASEKSIWEKKVGLNKFHSPSYLPMFLKLRQARTRRDTRAKWKYTGPDKANEEAAAIGQPRLKRMFV